MDERRFVGANAENQKEIIDSLLRLALGEKVKDEKLIDILVSSKGNCDQELMREYANNKQELETLISIGKLIAELKNNSTFENVIPEIVDSVDIFKGINELLILKENSTDKEKNEAIKRAGIVYVKSRIEHYLKESGISDNILFEYSLLSSTLDPEAPDELKCCSFVVGDDAFIEAVDECYTSCIEYTNDDKTGKGLSIYQHPHFLYNIPISSFQQEFDNTNLTIDDDTKTTVFLDGMGIAISSKISKGNTKGVKYSILDEDKKGGNFIRLQNMNGVAVEAFTLKRKFKEMLVDARNKSDGFSLVSCPSLEDVQNTLHSYCHKNITCADKRVSDGEERNSLYISFPIFGSRASNQLSQYEIVNKPTEPTALQGIGACFIYFEPKVDPESYKELIRLVIKKISYEIGKFIRFVSANYMFNLGLQLQENARKEAIKSAKAAIMSRNMSHNLGSHVMSYLKQHLGSVKDMLNDRIFSLLFESEDDMLQKLSVEIKDKIETSDKVALPFLVGLGHFISYLQERQDFIATIATDFIPYYSNVNFKDFIYDELNPDKRYERHKDRANLKIDNILLGNIARSEGLGRPTSPTMTLSGESDLSDIVINFRNFDGNPVKGPDANGKDIDTTDKKVIEGTKSLAQMRNYDVSLPGGVVGRQAIFSIVENVIRNAAKHGNWRDNNKLELTFDIYEKSDFEDPEKMISDNDNFGDGHLSLKEVFDKFYKDAEDSSDLYFVTLTDNLQFDGDKLAKLRSAIAEEYVNEKGVMEEANKGIKEMRISASWLRSMTTSDEMEIKPKLSIPDTPKNGEDRKQILLESLKFDSNWKVKEKCPAPILYARISNNHLQYIFCLMRPRKIAVISSDFPSNNSSTPNPPSKKLYNKKKFVELCWGAYTPEDYMELPNKSYEFILLDDTDEGRYKEIREISSSRLYKLSEVCGKYGFPSKKEFFEIIAKDDFDKKDAEDFLAKLYMTISKYDKDKDEIAIHDATAWSNLNSKENEISSEIISKGIVSVCKSGGVFHPYIYRTHYETDENFNIVINDIQKGKNYINTSFIEGITGNNSTDRLVRNEDIDELWSYKHLHAMKEKIAIFDERIFYKVYGREENDFLDDSGWRLRCAKKKSVDYLGKLLVKIDKDDKQCSLINSLIKNIGTKQTIEELECLLNSFQKLFNISSDILTEIFDKRIIAASFMGTAYAQKGISVFTLIRDTSQKNQFKLCGLKREDQNDVTSTLKRIYLGKDKEGKDLYQSYSICEVVANLTWDNCDEEKPLKIGACGETPISVFTNKFNHISIHQGLLDKMYEAFDIKTDANKKEKLTKCFYEIFSKSNDAISYEDENNSSKWLLPGMCIHSGRSKPSYSDMPQRLPFIQYAAIEHAVLDCKYSLVNLLDFARYEQEKNSTILNKRNRIA